MSGDAGGKTGSAWSRAGAAPTLSKGLACFSKSPSSAVSADRRSVGTSVGACETMDRRRLRSSARSVVVLAQSRLRVVSWKLEVERWLAYSSSPMSTALATRAPK